MVTACMNRHHLPTSRECGQTAEAHTFWIRSLCGLTMSSTSPTWHNQVQQYLAIAVLAAAAVPTAAAVPGATICLSCLHCFCCSRGMSPDDVDHFPYCVAEIKLQVQDVPPWLLGVVQSGGTSCRHACTCTVFATWYNACS